MKSQYKLTKQRKVILDELMKIEGHPTAEDIFEVVKKLQPNIGLCTVYRNLDRFSELGLIREIDGKLRRFDTKPHVHHHIRCLKCGKVDDLNHDVAVSPHILHEMGYHPEGVALDITGVCLECSLKKEKVERDLENFIIK